MTQLADLTRDEEGTETPKSERYSGNDSAAMVAVANDVQTHGALGAALRAVFLTNRDSSAFSQYMCDAIAGRDAALVAAATKSRLRIHDNACELLDARDMLSESASTLKSACSAATAATTDVDRAKADLAKCVTARQNLDEALEVAARTRSLVRVYARAEDMVSARRLHAALQTLSRLDASSSAVPDDAVLRDLLPQSAPLRSEILVLVRRALHTWLNTVRSDLPAVGAFALSRAFDDAERRKTASRDEQNSGKANSRFEDLKDVEEMDSLARLRWIPEVREDDIGIGGGSSRRVASSTAMSQGSTPRAEPGYAKDSTSSSLALSGTPKSKESTEAGNHAPRISMRSLLTCVLACKDLERTSELSTDYERERAGQLESGIDRISASDRATGAKLHAQVAAFVAGFFVAERTVESYTGVGLMEAESVAQLWSYSLGRIAQLRNTIEASETDVATMEQIGKTDAALMHMGLIYGLPGR